MMIVTLSATELARLIRTKTLSSREVVDAHLAQIERLNPRLNAIVTLTADRARDAAARADEALARGAAAGPLHGLPIAHKDLQWTAGIRTTFGSPIFKDFVPNQDSLLVAALKRAGAITIGKTNTPEFGAGSQTFNPIFGATVNPYDTSKTCGGSSGGAAVALRCGMVPIADGTDMGGSLRNPAAFTGVVGLRPSEDRVPTRTGVASWDALSLDGPMARSAQDVALLLGAMSGTTPPSLDGSCRGVRIAWCGALPGVPFDRRIRDVVDSRRGLFEQLGCVVEDRAPDFSGADEAFKALRAKAFVIKFGDLVARHRAVVKDAILSEIARGETLSAADVSRAEAQREALRRRVRHFMDTFEFVVLPTTQVPPFPVEQPYVTEIEGVAMPTYVDWMRSCYYISLLGQPAISVPCGLTPEGLPVGLQIVGRPGEDWGVLRIAHAFEDARGPFPAPVLDPSAERAGLA